MSESGHDVGEVMLYGIANCDQVRKARAWLTGHRIAHVFHDFKKAGLSESLLGQWIDRVGWECLLNHKGTTWRALDEARKMAVVDAASAIVLMRASPSVVKRPVLTAGVQVLVGFVPSRYQSVLGVPADAP